MATYTYQFQGSRTKRKKQKYSLLERTIDFSNTPKTGTGANPATTAFAAGDIIKAIKIRAGQTVLHVDVEIINLSTDSMSDGQIDQVWIGDGDNQRRYGSWKVGKSTGTTTKKAEAADWGGVDMYGAVKYYASADTIDVTLGAAFTNGRFKLIVHLLEDDR